MNAFERSSVWASVQSTDCWPSSRSCGVDVCAAAVLEIARDRVVVVAVDGRDGRAPRSAHRPRSGAARSPPGHRRSRPARSPSSSIRARAASSAGRLAWTSVITAAVTVERPRRAAAGPGRRAGTCPGHGSKSDRTRSAGGQRCRPGSSWRCGSRDQRPVDRCARESSRLQPRRSGSTQQRPQRQRRLAGRRATQVGNAAVRLSRNRAGDEPHLLLTLASLERSNNTSATGCRPVRRRHLRSVPWRNGKRGKTSGVVRANATRCACSGDSRRYGVQQRRSAPER